MRFVMRAGIVAVAALGVTACQSRPNADAADTSRPAASADSAAPSGANTGAAAGDTTGGTRADSLVLRTDKQQYRAGEKVTLTLENKGARSYAFNPCTRSLEREENGNWRVVEEPDRMCTMEAWILEPHGTRTGATELPQPLSAGRYRVVVRLTVEGSGTPAPAVIAVSDPITVT